MSEVAAVQQVVDESDREKSKVNVSNNPNPPMPAYRINGKAKYLVKEKGSDGKLRAMWKPFNVIACDNSDGTFMYKVKDELTGIVQNGENWIREGDLRKA